MSAILVLEASTSSAKAYLYDTVALTARTDERPFPDGDEPGSRDAEETVREVLRLGRDLLAGTPVDLVVLAATWHSLVLTDSSLTPVGPGLEWPWRQARATGAALRRDDDLVTEHYRRTGCVLHGIYPVVKLAHLAQEGASLAGLSVLDQGTYLFSRLTGRALTTASLLSGSGLLGLDGLPDPLALQIAGITRDQLPAIVPSESTAPMTPGAAAALGLAPGTPVTVAGPDGGLSQLGDHADSPEVMTLSMGTSGAMRVTSDGPRLSEARSTWAYRTPDSFLSGAAVSGCGNCVRWALDAFFPSGTSHRTAEGSGTAVARAPIFEPFLFGERCPGWNDDREGGFVGLRPEHGAAELYASVLEGVLFSLRQCADELRRLNGTPSEVRLSGGVVRSPVWRQMTANILDLPVRVSAHQHSSLLGGLRLGLRILGEEAASPLFESAWTVHPDPEAVARHDERYVRYLDAYDRWSAA